MDSDPQQIPHYRNKNNAHQIWVPKSPNSSHLSTSPTRSTSHRRNKSRGSDIPSDEELEGEAIVYHPNPIAKHLSKSPVDPSPITTKKSYLYPHVVEPTPIKPEDNENVVCYLSNDEKDVQNIVCAPKPQRTYKYGEVIQVEEDSEHEFKAIQNSKQPISVIAEHCEKYINAFLNTDGGTIYFGIHDDGTVLGIPMSRKFRDMVRLRVDSIVSSYKPQVDPHLCSVTFVPVTISQQQLQDRKKRNDSERGVRRPQSRGRYEYDDYYDEYDDYEEEEEEETEEEEDNGNYILEVTVAKGRAPLYYTHKNAAFFRRAGSTHMMDKTMMDSRLKMGRPIPERIFSVPRDFIGREEEIEKIREFVLQHQKNHTSIITALLFGLPVVGKSALARRLAAEYSSSYSDAHYYIDLKGISEHYVKLTDARISIIRNVYPSMTLPESKAEIKGLYDSCFTNKKCILVIENAGRAEQIRELAPLSCKQCFIIVTSRKDLKLDAEMDAITIRLGALKPEHAIELLETMVPKIDHKKAAQIAEMCGYLPLPIRMIGSTINSRRLSLAHSDSTEFVDQLRNNPDKRLASFQAVFDTYDSEITSYLYPISLFRGSFDNAAAASLFDCSFEKAADSLGMLLEYSLIDFDPKTSRYSQNELLKLHAYVTAHKEIDAKQLVEWKTRFIKHYINLFTELSKVDDAVRRQQIYGLEYSNVEVCREYAVALENSTLLTEFQNTMDHFLSGVERKRFKEQTSAFVLRKSIERVPTEETKPVEQKPASPGPNVK